MKILVLGAGRMGFGAVYDLAHNSPDVSAVTVADADFAKAEYVAKTIDSPKITPIQLDVAKFEKTSNVMQEHDSAISCVNYWFNTELSEIAIETNTNFCDLGGNNYVVDKQLALDEKAKLAGINIIPDCGLAPGMVSILAMHGANRFDEIEEIHIRVGGLPQNPTTAARLSTRFLGRRFDQRIYRKSACHPKRRNHGSRINDRTRKPFV